MSQVERVMQKCPQCQQVTEGFLIPDGRFICPTCFPPPVFTRWRREWEPIEKQRLQEQAAKEKAEQKQQLYKTKLKTKIEAKRQESELKAKAAEREHKEQEKPKPIACVFGYGIFVCRACGHTGQPIDADRHRQLRIVLLVVGILIWPLLIVWLVFGIIRWSHPPNDCPKCGAVGMVDINTPLGKSIIAATGKTEQQNSNDVKRFQCPECGESIPVVAKRCRFCQSVLTNSDNKNNAEKKPE